MGVIYTMFDTDCLSTIPKSFLQTWSSVVHEPLRNTKKIK